MDIITVIGYLIGYVFSFSFCEYFLNKKSKLLTTPLLFLLGGSLSLGSFSGIVVYITSRNKKYKLWEQCISSAFTSVVVGLIADNYITGTMLWAVILLSGYAGTPLLGFLVGILKQIIINYATNLKNDENKNNNSDINDSSINGM